jgi:hypothetical protein
VGTGRHKGIQILEQIAKLSPHFIIFSEEEVNSDTEAVLTFIEEKFETVSLIRLPPVPGSSDVPSIWGDLLLQKIKNPKPLYLPHAYANESRLVFHDPAFDNFSSHQKITSGSSPVDYQCAKLFRLLDGGKANHAHAKAYLTAIEESEPGLETEICYRMVHRSYKALSWTRDLAAKYISAAVHYVPSIERQFLPPPNPVHKSIDYVSYYQSDEGHYALSSLCQMRINPSVAELLVSSAQWVFSGQAGVTLLAEQAQLFGLAALLRQVVKSHVTLMEHWLDPSRGIDEEVSRETHRHEGVFRDFWDLGSIFERRDTLAKLLQAYHSKSWKPDFAFPPLPTYSEFRDKYSTGRGE